MRYITIILLLFSICLKAQVVEHQNQELCHFILSSYQESWKNDSLAQNGFRALFYFYCKCRCPQFNFNGFEWEEAHKILGNPNFEDGDWKWYWIEPDYPSGYYIAIRLKVDPVTLMVIKTVFETE
jgi:hypothetical protein